jgi:hypothetical protein
MKVNYSQANHVQGKISMSWLEPIKGIHLSNVYYGDFFSYQGTLYIKGIVNNASGVVRVRPYDVKDMRFGASVCLPLNTRVLPVKAQITAEVIE